MTKTKFLQLDQLLSIATTRKMNRHERRSLAKLAKMADRHEGSSLAKTVRWLQSAGV